MEAASRGLNADFMRESLNGTDLMGRGPRVSRKPEEHSSGHYESGIVYQGRENCRRIVFHGVNGPPSFFFHLGQGYGSQVLRRLANSKL